MKGGCCARGKCPDQKISRASIWRILRTPQTSRFAVRLSGADSQKKRQHQVTAFGPILPHPGENSMAFKARFRSTCLFCAAPITPGQWATWSRREKGKYVHQGCQDARAGISSPVPPVLTDTPDTSPESQGEAEGALDALAGALSRRLKLDTPATLDEARVKALAREVLDEQAPVQIVIGQDGREPVIVEGAHEAFPRLAYLAGLGRPIYLYGAHGTGKSYAARQLALALGRPFGYASLTKQSPVSLLLCYMDAQGRYVRTVFRDAYEHGHVFCQDELDNASPNYLSALNTPLENGHCAFPDGMVEH